MLQVITPRVAQAGVEPNRTVRKVFELLVESVHLTNPTHSKFHMAVAAELNVPKQLIYRLIGQVDPGIAE